MPTHRRDTGSVSLLALADENRAVAIFDMTTKFFDILPIEKWGLCPLLSNLGWFVTALTNRLGRKCAVDFKGG